MGTMRLFIIVAFVIIFQGCTQKKESASEYSDSISTDLQVSQELPTNLIQIPEDSSLFISHIMTFPETSEFYVPLYYLESHWEDTPYEYLSTQLDSLIYKNDEEGISRSRLPFNIAKEYFMLSGLSRISVYNKAGDLITDARLVRIEYLEDIIESEFIAVFKPMIPSWYTEDVAYCFSATPNNYKLINPSVKEIKDASLTTELFKRFEIDSSKVWITQHLQFFQYNSIYSIIALDRGSYLIETSESKSTILYETRDDYSVMEVSPVHIEINNKPVLLITEGKNETDMIWTALAVYSPKGYEVMSGSRIKKGSPK